MNRNYPQQEIDYKNAINHLKYLNGNESLKPKTLVRKGNVLLLKKSRAWFHSVLHLHDAPRKRSAEANLLALITPTLS